MSIIKLSRFYHDEPPMFLQRPSSGRSQDVTHILARTFRDLFTRDDVESEIVRNLNKSKSGDDTYHDKYVEELRKIQAERERRMAEALMLERHIMQARARSMAADEKQLNKAAEGCDIYHDLGLPPVGSNFKHCLDSELLRKHGLIVPEDFSTAEPPPAAAPKASLQPRYAEATETSNQHVEDRFAQDHKNKSKPRNRPNMSETDVIDTLINDTKKGRGQQWKEMTSPQTRERNRTDMAIVHKKSDFLRNPRHRPPSSTGGGKSLVKPNTVVHKLGGAKSTVVDTQVVQKPSVVFIATPSTIVFSEYQVGKVYEMTLDLKNVSAASRQLRMVPPKTQYFSIGLGKFPGEQGIVAPGMSCQYSIRFRPDSLKDFDDQITVQTQSSQPMVIQVLGRRPPPKLSLLPIIDCGHCLIGGQRIAEFKIKNEGGSGRFSIMPRESWPATNFKSVATKDRVDLQPFVIEPSLFELLAGHTITLQIIFTPPSIRSFSRDITMVCDNCTVRHFTVKGEGQTAGVELASVSGGESFPTPGEMCDSTAQHQIKFDPVNPMTYVTKQIVIRNSTNVELPFNWSLLRPHLECQDPAVDDTASVTGLISRQGDGSNCFCINPERGILQPQGLQKATVAFAPTMIGSHHSVLHLILQGVPEDRQSSASSVSSRSSSGSVHSRDGCHDVVGLEVEVKGDCVEYDVAITPYAILVPGELLVSTSTRQQFQMINFSKFPINFKWSSMRDCHLVEVETPEGQIPAETTAQLELTITGGCPGLIDHTLLCHIEHQEKPLTLRVIANIKGPEVIIDTPSIDFGLVRYGQITCQRLHIRNKSQVAAHYEINESPEFRAFHPDLGKAVSEFTLTPSGGDLPPLGSAFVDIKFKPRSCRLVNTVFECNIADSKDSFIPVTADVQHPQVCLLCCRLHMEEVYAEVPVSHTVTLVNQAQLEADFTWGEPRGSQASTCEVTFDPQKGRLRPGEHLPVTVKFLSHQQGELNDVQIPCHVDGMKHPVYLALSSDVKGLTVSYKTPKAAADNRFADNTTDEEQNAPLLLDFGPNAELGSIITRQVIIRNHTAIASPYNIRVARLPAAKPPTPPSTEEKNKETKGARRGLLSRTQNLADPKSRTPAQVQADHSKGVLQGGNGAAFVVYPTLGVLQPFSELKIDVTAYSDMWGDYTDDLLCKVADLETVEIPIELKVTGCPLGFKMATLKGQLPVVRFGTHVSGLPHIQRPLQLRNTSPYDIRIDWQIYNLIPRDRKLLDMLVTFGNPFPLLDENGEEVILDDCEDIRPLSTHSIKDKFCDSPTTSMAAISEKGSLLSKITQELEHEQQRFEDMEEEEERVISVRIREHDGVPADGPFSLSSKQMLVPARSCLNMSAAFTPIIPNLSAECGHDCTGFALGYMSLDKTETCLIPGEVTRSQGLEIAPLRLDFSAYIKPALLTIETAEEEGMRYLTAASDLLQRPNEPDLLPKFISSHAATLTNATQTPLAFRIIAPHPFLVQTIDPRSKGKGEYQGVMTTGEVILPQQKNLQVRVAFVLTEHLLASSLTELSVGDTKDGFSLVEKEGERRLHIRQDLQMHYNNGSVQRLPLHAVVTIPSLIITPTEIDFGTCLVGQLREKEIVIRNHTGSATYWTTAIVAAGKSPESGVFGVVPSEGYLQAYITHVSNSKMVLRVQFTAKHNIPYESKLVFHGHLGEIPQELSVKGQGSYDSRHEALVNI
ncbi:LOW QUALITY PROTEIN: deleted in lung and esophageal cancer protein 1-like [Amphiura filiformis]|uniref:LOW QUALITY PROTEIN: deleted in lung and esophageal cancer protein 1-like n=1 Tax=Amphiura filiformis TaxID=82378 RepID=UPI003B214FB5